MIWLTSLAITAGVMLFKFGSMSVIVAIQAMMLKAGLVVGLVLASLLCWRSL